MKTTTSYTLATAIAACILPQAALPQEQQQTLLFSRQAGEFKVTLLPERQRESNSSILIDAAPEIIARYTREGRFPSGMNAFLLQDGKRAILVDTGLGINLASNLAASGTSPAKIDTILLTHMHGDHIGGMLKNGKAVFPNANVYIPQAEHDYWMSDEAMQKVPEPGRKSFLQAREVIKAYKNRLHLFEPGAIGAVNEAIIPGITPLKAYGHTPGHTMYLLGSGEDRLLIWGDLTHAMAVQMPHPEISVTYDVDPGEARQSRTQVLEYVSKERIPIAGMHIAYPGGGTVTANSGEGNYTFAPFKE